MKIPSKIEMIVFESSEILQNYILTNRGGKLKKIPD